MNEQMKCVCAINATANCAQCELNLIFVYVVSTILLLREEKIQDIHVPYNVCVTMNISISIYAI